MGRQLGCSSTSGCLIRRLSSFLLHRLPRFGLGLLWIYPPALSCQPLCLVLQAFEPFSPCCSGTLAGLRALVPPRSHREVEQTFPACPAAWLDRARVLGSANLSPRAGFFVLGRRASGRALCQRETTPHLCHQKPCSWLLAFTLWLGVGLFGQHCTLHSVPTAQAGPLSSSPSVSHGFSSELEAKVYVDAAGLQWPLGSQSRLCCLLQRLHNCGCTSIRMESGHFSRGTSGRPSGSDGRCAGPIAICRGPRFGLLSRCLYSSGRGQCAGCCCGLLPRGRSPLHTLCCRSAARALDFLREQPARGHSRSSHPSSACPGLGSRRRECRQAAILLSRRGGTGGSTKEAGSVASYKDRCAARRSGFNFRRWRAFNRKAFPTKESGNHCQPGKSAPDHHCLVACADEVRGGCCSTPGGNGKTVGCGAVCSAQPGLGVGSKAKTWGAITGTVCWAHRLALRKPSLLHRILWPMALQG